MSEVNPGVSVRRICWVEDDACILHPCMERLQEKGYQIEIIETMQETLDRYKEVSSGDLIIIDLLIRHVDPTHDDEEEPPGIDLIRELQRRDCRVPIIVITVIFNKQVEEKLRAMGILHILSKPVHPHTIEETVENVLCKQR